MKPRVFVDGDQGTTGLQIVSRLSSRSDVSLVTLPPEQRKDSACRSQAINDCDIAILCLPDDAARSAVASVKNDAVRIIDASSAHRTHPSWTYGFPEMARGQDRMIACADRVSNPGCFPTGTIALLRPLLQAGLLPRDYPFSMHAVSGYSGRGRSGIEAHEQRENCPDSSADSGAFTVYGLQLEHKHLREMEVHAGLLRGPIFIPSCGNFRQGIVLTIPLHLDLLPAAVRGEQLHECLTDHFVGSRNVDVMPLAQSRSMQQLDPQALNGTDKLRLAVLANDRRGQVVLAAVFDNLGKGAAGAACQNLDLMLGQS
jgi:N-acetyl-gamma-glutamyl-phosphate reductase